MSIDVYCFYNNKGGVGKTTLCQNAAAHYAALHPKTFVLVVDMCPQANISQFLLGGGHKGFLANQTLQSAASRKNIVGFVDWLLKGNSGFTTPNTRYGIQVSRYNPQISDNLYLIAGDNFLESLSLALNYAVINPANLQAWQEYMTALRRLFDYEHAQAEVKKTTVFLDCNPSFSVYTQMALLSSDHLVVPMMADFTSIEGIKGIFGMLYGKYTSPATQKYAQNIVTFSKQVASNNVQLPTIFEVVFNNFTVREGVASAFGSLRNELTEYCYTQFQAFPSLFTTPVSPIANIDDWRDLYVSDVKDFHTAGKVSASLGIPLFQLPQKNRYTMPDGEVIEIPVGNYTKAVDNMDAFVRKLQ